ncbi:MAG: ABC transporter permease, partial [Burkholderiales bacterium]|nr:ABC transporter permease [Burkholderiales bacterium]
MSHPRPPSIALLAWRQTRRDLRAGELRLLVFAVLLAVAALTAVGFFADRLDAGLQRDSYQLLGGDAVIESDEVTPPAFAAQARALGLRTSDSATFPSMARAPDDRGGATRLVAVKAVDAAYPLRGRMQLRQRPDGPVQVLAAAPPPGQAWVDASLLDALQLRLGDTLQLGDATLKITRLIVVEPDRGTGFTSFAPRVMLALTDLPATGLVQPASRIGYRLAVAAPAGWSVARGDATVRRYTDWCRERVRAQSLRGIRIQSVESGRPEMKQALDRATKFLNLVALLAALLAAVAVAIAARDFAARRLDGCAMLRVLGLSQRRIAGAYAIEFGLVGLAASGLGLLVGLALHGVFVALLAGLVAVDLPPPGPGPALFGLGIGMTLLLAFGLPPVLQLARVPPLRVIRRDVGALAPASLAVLAAGLVGFVALLLAATSDLRMGLIAVGGFAAAVAFFAVASWAAVRLMLRLVPAAGAPRWLLLATRQVGARPAYAVLQVSALAVGLLALVLLILLRTDLIASWREATPPDAPDRFVINIQPDQAGDFRAALTAGGVARYDWYPMIRGRLVAVDGAPVRASNYADARARRLVEREFNLSHSAVLPPKNDVVAGRWVADEAGAISVEQGLAQELGLKLGDTLRFDIAGQFREGRITSLRKVDWGSMRPNFFVLFPLARMDDLPLSYISAFRAPPQHGFDASLARRFPNITDIDVS